MTQLPQTKSSVHLTDQDEWSPVEGMIVSALPNFISCESKAFERALAFLQILEEGLHQFYGAGFRDGP